MIQFHEITPGFVFCGCYLAFVPKMSQRRFERFMGMRSHAESDSADYDDAPLDVSESDFDRNLDMPSRQGISVGRVLRDTDCSSHAFNPGGKKKASTLRSFRNSHAIGGDSRKATRRKLDRRMPVKSLRLETLGDSSVLIG